MYVASIEEDDEAEEEVAPPSLRQRLGFLAGDFWRDITDREEESRGRSLIVFPPRHSGESCCGLSAYSPHAIVIRVYHACFRTRHFLVNPYCRNP